MNRPDSIDRSNAVAALGAVRAGFGVVSLIAPQRMAEAWFGPDTPSAARPAVRAIGVRDLVIAAGMVAGGSSRTRAVATRAAALADTSDVVTSLAMYVRSRHHGPVLGALTAATGAVLAWLLLPGRSHPFALAEQREQRR